MRKLFLLLLIPTFLFGQTRGGMRGTGGISLKTLADSVIVSVKNDTAVIEGGYPMTLQGLRVLNDINVGNTLIMRTISNSPIKNVNGTSAKPAYTFLNDSTAGLSRDASNGTLIFSQQGTQSLGIMKTHKYNFGSIAGDTANGIINMTRQKTTNNLLYLGNDFNATKDSALTVTSSGNVKIVDGSTVTPALTFGNDATTGLSRNTTTGGITFSEKGLQKLSISKGGKFTYGSNPADTLVEHTFVSSGGVNTGIFVTNNALDVSETTPALRADSASIRMQVLSTGDALVRLRGAKGVYDSTSMGTTSNGSFLIGSQGYTGQYQKRFYFNSDTLMLVNGSKTGRDSAMWIMPNGSLTTTGSITMGTGTAWLSFANNLVTDDSLTVDRKNTNLADDASYSLATAVSGWGTVMAGNNEQWADFVFSSDGTVTLKSNSAKVSKTASAGDDSLMVYDGGGGIVIKNRLGASKKVAWVINYYTP